jgi:hypothetical protein
MIRSRRMRWVRHVLFVREKRNVYTVAMENLQERRPVGRIKLDYRIILKWMLEE